jgi:peroxiredoxin Q/BCP
MLKVGDRAPEFSALSTEGRVVRLSDYRGHRLVLYFFPLVFTPGCTQQARRFRDNHAELEALGASVLGVSVDDSVSQCDFARAERLTFPMLSDESRTLSRAYGVLRPVLFVDQRITYVIDERGFIEAVFHHEFQISRHLDDVLRHLQGKRPLRRDVVGSEAPAFSAARNG